MCICAVWLLLRHYCRWTITEPPGFYMVYAYGLFCGEEKVPKCPCVSSSLLAVSRAGRGWTLLTDGDMRPGRRQRRPFD